MQDPTWGTQRIGSLAAFLGEGINEHTGVQDVYVRGQVTVGGQVITPIIQLSTDNKSRKNTFKMNGACLERRTGIQLPTDVKGIAAWCQLVNRAYPDGLLVDLAKRSEDGYRVDFPEREILEQDVAIAEHASALAEMEAELAAAPVADAPVAAAPVASVAAAPVAAAPVTAAPAVPAPVVVAPEVAPVVAAPTPASSIETLLA